MPLFSEVLFNIIVFYLPCFAPSGNEGHQDIGETGPIEPLDSEILPAHWHAENFHRHSAGRH